MAAHRVWRLSLLTTNNPYGYVIGDVQFRTTPGTALAFTAGTATAASTYGGAVAGNAGDGNAGTEWDSVNLTPPQWWQWDFGAGNAIDVAQIMLTAPNNGGYIQMPLRFDVLTSDDGVTFTTVAGFVAAAWTAAAQTQLFDVPTPIADAPVSGTTLDPVWSSANLTLSGGDLTATAVTAALSVARSTTLHSGGKYYFEFTPATIGASDVIGVCSPADVITDPSQVYFCGVSGNGSIWSYGANVGACQGASGTPWGFALDIDSGQLWIRTAPANGYNIAGSGADPVTEVAGLDIAYLLPSLLAAIYTQDAGHGGTFNFVGPFIGALPTGYSAWDGAAITPPVTTTHPQAVIMR